MRAVLVFLAVAAADWVWAKYIHATSQKQVWRAACYAGCVPLLGGITTIAIVDDARYIIPAAFGAFCGTLLALRS